jgi:hypothetical protein
MDHIANFVGGVVWTVVSVLGPPTVVLLLLRRFVPALGNPLWRVWCRLLTWLIVGPIRLVRLLVREAIGHRGR